MKIKPATCNKCDSLNIGHQDGTDSTPFYCLDCGSVDIRLPQAIEPEEDAEYSKEEWNTPEPYCPGCHGDSPQHICVPIPEEKTDAELEKEYLKHNGYDDDTEIECDCNIVPKDITIDIDCPACEGTPPRIETDCDLQGIEVIVFKYKIGDTVEFIDKKSTQPEPEVGQIVGTDPSPRESTRRKGPAYWIAQRGRWDAWLLREEAEIQKVLYKE